MLPVLVNVAEKILLYVICPQLHIGSIIEVLEGLWVQES